MPLTICIKVDNFGIKLKGKNKLNINDETLMIKK
jgi:hypothetical protein